MKENNKENELAAVANNNEERSPSERNNALKSISPNRSQTLVGKLNFLQNDNIDEHFAQIHKTQQVMQQLLGGLESDTRQVALDLSQLCDRLKNNNQYLNKLLQKIAENSGETYETGEDKKEFIAILEKIDKMSKDSDFFGEQKYSFVQNEILGLKRVIEADFKELINSKLTQVMESVEKVSLTLSTKESSIQSEVQRIIQSEFRRLNIPELERLEGTIISRLKNEINLNGVSQDISELSQQVQHESEGVKNLLKDVNSPSTISKEALSEIRKIVLENNSKELVIEELAKINETNLGSKEVFAKLLELLEAKEHEKVLAELAAIKRNIEQVNQTNSAEAIEQALRKINGQVYSDDVKSEDQKGNNRDSVNQGDLESTVQLRDETIRELTNKIESQSKAIQNFVEMRNLVDDKKELESKIEKLKANYDALCKTYEQKFNILQLLQFDFQELAANVRETTSSSPEMRLHRLNKVHKLHASKMNEIQNFRTKEFNFGYKRVLSTPMKPNHPLYQSLIDIVDDTIASNNSDLDES
ncbi:uncharacterized protein PRCAT00001030001 [Priceomyces carsonii]|uniref:uncharacterized protein n=1 Tax=Priceomyces carsonii TaxID=28549 RepID=UPI002EDB8C58|nr:unnamed protein product [Priceomyces carsonii]